MPSEDGSDFDTRYDPDSDFDRWQAIAVARCVVPFIRPGDQVLELGCAKGYMTGLFVNQGAKVTAIDFSPVFLEVAKTRVLSGVDWIQEDLNNWKSNGEYHHVILSRTLHFVREPKTLIAESARSLLPGGLLHVAVPNPRSIHRIVGSVMGVISDLGSCKWNKERPLPSVDDVVRMAQDAGLSLMFRAGRMLKPLPADLMDELPDKLIEGFISAEVYLPEYAAVNHFLFAKAK